MKHFYSLFLLAFLCACGSPLRGEYRVVFPGSPPLRQELLGPPHWRLEWYDSGGVLRERDIYGAAADIAPPEEWASAVLAWPFWPEKGILPGLFYPAGALVPFDTRGTEITLSWEAGPEAVFYREMNRTRSEASPFRSPQYFDWPRFRAFLRNEAPEGIRSDPWLADWAEIAEKTIRSGFDKRRIKALSRRASAFTAPYGGPWLGASPFKAPESWEAGEALSLLLAPGPEIFICPGGIWTVSGTDQVWREFE